MTPHDATKVTAVYKDGVLEVTVPKIETAKLKKVEIKVAEAPAGRAGRRP